MLAERMAEFLLFQTLIIVILQVSVFYDDKWFVSICSIRMALYKFGVYDYNSMQQ